MSPPSLPPVTILCGFLGAGKTTLLNHLVRQAEGRRWALVVNDVGAINLDARLVAQNAATLARPFDTRDLVELGNGCVCCSNKDDLAETIMRLAIEGTYDHLLIETTGVAEPRPLASLFLQRNPFGRSVGDVARLSALVTVVDTPDFLRLWRTHGPTAPSRAPATSGPRPLFELMLEQVECADILLLNKCDRATPTEADELAAVLHALNPHADLLRTEHGQVMSEWLLDRPRFDATSTLGGAAWIRELNALAPTPAIGRPAALTPPARPVATRATPDYTTRYGLRSFVFQARRPFVQERWHALLARGLPGIVRAKGFYWLRERPDEMAFLSLAGGVLRHEWPNYWWATLVEQGRARLDERPPLIRALWQEPHGDRRQELVFIGVDFEEPVLRRALESCLA